MHVQMVTFGLNGVTEDEYHRGCQDETGVFADLPGLLAKVWLRKPEKNVFGAVYLWADRASCEAYTAGPVFRSIQEDSSLSDVVSEDYDVYEDLSAVTHPGLQLEFGGPAAR